MPSFESGPLPKKLPELHKEPQIERAVEKSKREGEKVPNTPEAKIGTYLNQLDKILTHPDERQRERNLILLKPFLHDEFVISEEEFPESYFELQKRIYRERGQAVEEFTNHQKQQMIEVVREDQTKSLDDWVDYLASDDAGYPTWFKYLAFRNITKLSQFDKEKGHFKKRSKDTVAPYPDIYREALGIVADKLGLLAQGDPSKFENDEEYKRFAEGKFPDLYAEAIQKTLEATVEGKENIQGEWVRYAQGNMEDAERLYSSLQGKGTGWCTAGKSTAENQISAGDFYVYYSYKDKSDDQPSQPRIAIRMHGDEIAEVRGVLPGQEIEPALHEIVGGKLNEFGTKADKFKKKSEDMSRMTSIESKINNNEELGPEELRFLYELDAQIEGFGYNRDPRIQILLTGRNWKEDMQTIFSALNDHALVLALIDSRQKVEIIQRLNEFPDINHEIVANKLLDAPGGEVLVAQNLKNFKNLSLATAKRICGAASAIYDVLNGADSFNCNKTDIIRHLILKGYTDTVINHFKDEEEFASIMRMMLADDLQRQGIAAEPLGQVVDRTVASVPDKEYLLNRIKDHWARKEVVAGIRQLQGLDTEAAIALVENSEAKVVLENLDMFHNLDRKRLIKALLQDSRFDFGDLRKESIDVVPKYEALAEHIDEFPEIDRDAFAEKLLSSINADILARNIRNFPNYDNQGTWDRLTKIGPYTKGQSIRYLKNFKNVNSLRVLTEVIQEGDAEMVVRNLQDYPLSINQPIADELIRQGETEVLAKDISKFSGLNNSTALALIQAGMANTVSNNLRRFVDLNNEIASHLIKEGQGDAVIYNLKEFNAESKVIAWEFVKSEHYQELYTKLDAFEDLDFEIALILLQHGGRGSVIYSFDSFENPDFQAAAKVLLEQGEGKLLADTLRSFSGLDDATAQALINNGYGKEVAYRQGSFSNLQPDTVKVLERARGNL
jgi:hypothetical protein